MKRFRQFLLAAAFLTLFPVSSYSIELTDYKIPESSSLDLYLNGAFNLQDGNQEQTSYNGFASANFKSRYSSIPMVWSIQADGQVDVQRGSADGDDTLDGYNVFAKSTLDKYYKETNFFGFGSLDVGHRKDILTSHEDDTFVQVGGGLGYGRIYNATVLAQAMRIVDDLQKYQVITRVLSDAGYLKLAQIIDRRDEFRSKYSAAEYKKYWYEEMEKVFLEEGITSKPTTLGALGIIRMEEILDEERFSTRNYGWLVRGGVGYIISNYDGEEGDPVLNFTFEYGLPYSFLLQFNELFQYSTVLQDDQVHNFLNSMSLTYEISNRIDWENAWIFNALLPTAEGEKDIVKNTLSTGFRYYLTNTVSANANVSLNMTEDNIDNNGNDDLETKVFIGLTYRVK